MLEIKCKSPTSACVLIKHCSILPNFSRNLVWMLDICMCLAHVLSAVSKIVLIFGGCYSLIHMYFEVKIMIPAWVLKRKISRSNIVTKLAKPNWLLPCAINRYHSLDTNHILGILTQGCRILIHSYVDKMFVIILHCY